MNIIRKILRDIRKKLASRIDYINGSDTLRRRSHVRRKRKFSSG